MEFEEECFAPNAFDDSDVESLESVELPVRRHAKRSSLYSVKDLKEENLKQIQQKLKKEEEEQIRYLSLDNATKDVIIEELKERIKHYQALLKPIQEFEESFAKVNKNISTLRTLIENVPNKEYKELMNEESEKIVVVNRPTAEIPDLEKSLEILNNTFTNKLNEQEILRQKFHEELITKVSRKRLVYRTFETIVGLLILITLIRFVLWL